MSGVPRHGVSGWQRDTPPVSPQPPLDAGTDARFVVVGAGLSGLALAHHLTQSVPPEEILVVEAGRAGCGASGRSTGIVGPGVGTTITALVRKYGSRTASHMFGASLEGVAALRQLAKELLDDCELTDTYQLVAAKTPAHAARLRDRAHTLSDQLGFDVRYLDQDATAARIGVDGYHGALCYPDAATVNPWLLCQALKQSLLDSGVRIAEQTLVTAIVGGQPVTLTAGGYRVRTDTAVLATDGFTPDGLGLHRHAIAAIRTHVLRTEILPTNVLASTGWDGQGAVIDSRSFFNYFRLTPQRRLLFGGGPAILDHQADGRAVAAVRTRLVRELHETFPALAGVEIADFWSGVTATTLDRLPIVGPVPGQPRVWFAGAWCGHGLAMSVHTAEHLARALTCAPTATAEAELPWMRTTASWIPSGRLGVALRSAYLRALDGGDRLATRGARRT